MGDRPAAGAVPRREPPAPHSRLDLGVGCTTGSSRLSPPPPVVKRYPPVSHPFETEWRGLSPILEAQF